MSDLKSFQLEVREWLAGNCPAEMRLPFRDNEELCWGGKHWVFSSDAQRQWLERMVEKGWAAPTWPQQYGGAGLSREQATVLGREMARIGARPPLIGMGIWMLGPALLKFGSDEQKQQHLPAIARGEMRWCQGYSEPGAGSDLAGLSTLAEDRGDHFVVNGQKIWNSYADESDAIFCLARTDTEAPKHDGISFLLFDMDLPGITTRPIRLISGNSPFCETFFDNVKVPKSGLLGEINKGWTVAKYVLVHERNSLESVVGSGRGIDPVKSAVRCIGLEDGKLADSVFRTSLAAHGLDAMCMELLIRRYTDEAKAGMSTGASSSVLKYLIAEVTKQSLDLTMQAEGFDALRWDDQQDPPGGVAAHWLNTKAYSIAGGTSEIQLNVIAKRILDLPV